MSSRRFLPKDQAWALGGGKLDPERLPAWVDRDTIRKIALELSVLGPWASAGFRNSVEIGLASSTGLRSNAIRVSETSYLCVIPVGLVIRLDYLIRLLEREHNKPKHHVVDPDFHGDLPDEMKSKREQLQPPEPIRTITDNSLHDEEFWARFETIDEDDRNQGRSQYRSVQIDQLRLAVLSCALHESAHALRQHSRILDESSNKDAVERGAELDADARSSMWLALYRYLELITNVGTTDRRKFSEALVDSSWRMTYALCVVFGVFDVDRLSIGAFLADTYHHPSVRLQIATNGMFEGLAANLGSEAVKGLLIRPSAYAASEYMSRMTQFWMKNDPGLKCRRPTSLYFPMTPILIDLFEEASNEYREFLTEHEDVLRKSRK